MDDAPRREEELSRASEGELVDVDVDAEEMQGNEAGSRTAAGASSGVGAALAAVELVVSSPVATSMPPIIVSTLALSPLPVAVVEVPPRPPPPRLEPLSRAIVFLPVDAAGTRWLWRFLVMRPPWVSRPPAPFRMCDDDGDCDCDCDAALPSGVAISPPLLLLLLASLLLRPPLILWFTRSSSLCEYRRPSSSLLLYPCADLGRCSGVGGAITGGVEVDRKRGEVDNKPSSPLVIPRTRSSSVGDAVALVATSLESSGVNSSSKPPSPSPGDDDDDKTAMSLER